MYNQVSNLQCDSHKFSGEFKNKMRKRCNYIIFQNSNKFQAGFGLPKENWGVQNDNLFWYKVYYRMIDWRMSLQCHVWEDITKNTACKVHVVGLSTSVVSFCFWSLAVLGPRFDWGPMFEPGHAPRTHCPAQSQALLCEPETQAHTRNRNTFFEFSQRPVFIQTQPNNS
jgi:hypothetical protein